MATVNLSPLFNGQTIFGPTGLPLANGQIFTYQAGSSTALATYTTNSGTIANTNPIILGTDGKLPQELWLTYGYSYKLVLQDSVGVVINTYDNIAGILTQIPTTTTVLPTGCIIVWSGSQGSIPTGFVLCNGSNSTPDLRDKFVIGAGNSYTVGQTGGSADAIVVSHTHTVTDPGHLHNTTSTGSGTLLNAAASGTTGASTSTTATATTGITLVSAGTSGTNANLPPYYALCYIMKT
jgi:hypothetical protein